jgi:hypothetical protein
MPKMRKKREKKAIKIIFIHQIPEPTDLFSSEGTGFTNKVTTRSAGAVVSALESHSPEKLVHIGVTFTTGPCRSFNVAIQHHDSLTRTADPPSSF